MVSVSAVYRGIPFVQKNNICSTKLIKCDVSRK